MGGSVRRGDIITSNVKAHLHLGRFPSSRWRPNFYQRKEVITSVRPRQSGSTGVGYYSRFGKVRVPPQIGRPQSVIRFQFKQLGENVGNKLLSYARSSRRTDPSYQVPGELVIDVVVDDRGYIPSPNLVTHSTGLGREEALKINPFPQSSLTWHRCHRTHLSGVHLVDDDAKRPHVHRAGKGRPGVLDEQLGGLVRVRPAVGEEDTLVKRLVFTVVRLQVGGQRYSKVGDRDVSVPRDEDIAGLEVTMDDALVVEFVHGQSLYPPGVLCSVQLPDKTGDVQALQPRDG